MKIPLIEVESLSKKYKIGPRIPYSSLRETIVDIFKKPKEKLPKEDFWALKDISFKVFEGDVIGIIGKNGAGKSTLLKIISRITLPTKGSVRLKGKVASLLEIGTGFHPELTGRENIYLNGVILGMSRASIKRKFKSIVSFSGIEKFIDTQVKFYSSGMHTRLAFSVASHVDSDILIVDEVLSVGDYEFQKKSLNKIANISKRGRTVLFVSHSLNAVAKLCDRILLLEEGRLIEDGKTEDVIRRYLGKTDRKLAVKTWVNKTAPGDDVVRLYKVCVKDKDGKIRQKIDIRHDFTVEMEYRVLKNDTPLLPSIQLINEQGYPVFSSNDTEFEWNDKARDLGRYKSRVNIPGNFLANGDYAVRVVIGTLKPYHKHLSLYDVVNFHIADAQGLDTARGNYGGSFPGIVRPILKWKTYYQEK